MWNNLREKAATAYQTVALTEDPIPRYKEAINKLKSANQALKKELEGNKLEYQSMIQDLQKQLNQKEPILISEVPKLNPTTPLRRDLVLQPILQETIKSGVKKAEKEKTADLLQSELDAANKLIEDLSVKFQAITETKQYENSNLANKIHSLQQKGQLLTSGHQKEVFHLKEKLKQAEQKWHDARKEVQKLRVEFKAELTQREREFQRQVHNLSEQVARLKEENNSLQGSKKVLERLNEQAVAAKSTHLEDTDYITKLQDSLKKNQQFINHLKKKQHKEVQQLSTVIARLNAEIKAKEYPHRTDELKDKLIEKQVVKAILLSLCDSHDRISRRQAMQTLAESLGMTSSQKKKAGLQRQGEESPIREKLYVFLKESE